VVSQWEKNGNLLVTSSSPKIGPEEAEEEERAERCLIEAILFIYGFVRFLLI